MKDGFSKSELASLQRLRNGFLKGTAGQRDYWQSDQDLALYDATFAERIGWKWDAVLRELHLRGWHPPADSVLDWGCGTGIAGRRVLKAYPQLHSLQLHDRSARARRFAAERVIEEAKGTTLFAGTPSPKGKLVLLSHVLNELRAGALSQLLEELKDAEAIIWVEAGTHSDSRHLSSIRGALLDSGLHLIAPCPHAVQCPMLEPIHQRHWCHHFAQPPAEIFQSGRWEQFRRELGIDLRSLPYSFFVFQRKEVSRPLPDDCQRVIGRPREFKGHDKVLACSRTGLKEWILQKRDAPELLRDVRAPKGLALYQWDGVEGKILRGASLPPEPQAPSAPQPSDPAVPPS